eukprot:TRINITY_DN8709_c0_g1_i2.p3 TRINITY_DN8709_c0_g1~~TRINITY_DN8709_c0_g1_i2.p3  ORF type:complete len:103 (+),score=29.62 TRINITY_DN8709_c0_g1_i2:1-309(+)
MHTMVSTANLRKLDELALRAGHAQLEEGQALYAAAGGAGEVQTRLEEAADCRETLLRAVQEHRADVVVLGTRRLGTLAKLLATSTSSYIIHHSTNASVLVVH